MSDESPERVTSRASFNGYSGQPRDLKAAPAAGSNRRRWTVVEEFDRDGFQYRVSRRPIDSAVGAQLTSREKEVLGYASTGYNNKLIAKALGVAPSTVGVLLFRAAAKVGAKSRRELLRAYALMNGTANVPSHEHRSSANWVGGLRPTE